jgi:hypothetical protein
LPFQRGEAVIVEPLPASALGLKDLSDIPDWRRLALCGVSFGRIDQAIE